MLLHTLDGDCAKNKRTKGRDAPPKIAAEYLTGPRGFSSEIPRNISPLILRYGEPAEPAVPSGAPQPVKKQRPPLRGATELNDSTKVLLVFRFPTA